MADSILVDVNVCLDLLLDRHPYVEFSGQIFELAEQNEFNVFVSGLSFDTLFYIMRPSLGAVKSTHILNTFSHNVKVGTVNQTVVRQALKAEWKDLEDALQYYCAVKSGCSTLVTRNITDFKSENSALSILTPEQFLNSR